MDDKMGFDFGASQVQTTGGTDEGSVYIKVAETDKATLSVRPLLFPSIPHPRAALVLGARLRLELKHGEFPVVPEDDVKAAFGFQTLERRSNKHLSTMIGVPFAPISSMFHYLRKLISDNALVEKMVDGVLSRMTGVKGVTLLVTREQLIDIYVNLLDDEIPNMLPGPLNYAFKEGKALHETVFDSKPIPA